MGKDEKEKYEYRDVAITMDGKQVATAASLGSFDYSSVQLWNAETGKQRAVLRGHRAKVSSVAFNPEGTVLLSGSHDGTARLWGVLSKESLGILRGHSDQISRVAFSPNGDLLATSSADGTTRLWNLSTNTAKATLRHKNWVFDASYDSLGKRILTASLDNTATIWDAETGTALLSLKGHKNAIMRAFFNPEGIDPYKDRVLTTSLDGSFRNWDTQTGNELAVTWLKKGIWEAALSPNGKYLATAFNDGTVSLWESGADKFVGDLTARNYKGEMSEGSAHSIKFSPDNTMVAVAYKSLEAGRSADAKVFDTKHAKLLFTLSGHRETIKDIAFHPNSNLVATASEDNTARIWKLDAETLDVIRQLQSSDDDEIAFPKQAKAEQIALLRGHTDGIFSVAFSHNGDRVVTTSRDSTARVWDTKTGDEISVFNGHTDMVHSAEFDPSDQFIATASEDRTVRLWEVTTGKPVNIYRDHYEEVHIVKFSPSGQQLLTASYDNSAKVFDVKPLNVDYLISRANKLISILGLE